MRNITRIFNEVEAGVWLTIAIGFLICSFKAAGERQKIGIICFVAFLIFGISDIIESRTGAWWRPLWLLAMKIPCVITFIYCYLKYKSIQKTTEPNHALEPTTTAVTECAPSRTFRASCGRGSS